MVAKIMLFKFIHMSLLFGLIICSLHELILLQSCIFFGNVVRSLHNALMDVTCATTVVIFEFKKPRVEANCVQIHIWQKFGERYTCMHTLLSRLQYPIYIQD